MITWLITRLILRSRIGSKIQDIPNQRSLHGTPTPRIGGVGLVGGLLAGWLILRTGLSWWLVLPLVLLFVVSLLDDVKGLPVRVRLPLHLVASVIMVGGSGFWGAEGVLAGILVALLSVWMTNLYNFMDGSNGLAGGMAVSGFGFYGVAAWLAGQTDFAMLNFCIAASALGFLYFNLHPARVFMGDAGSIPLGFLAAAMGLQGWQSGCWPVWFPLLVFSPFIVDASVTLMKRSLRGAKVTEAHREHYYQHAVQMGRSHLNVALHEYVLMIACGVTALWAVQQIFPWVLFLIWGAVYAALMLYLDNKWKHSGRAHA